MLTINDSKHRTIDIEKRNHFLRRHSFSEGDQFSLKNKLKEINNSPLSLRRSELISNLALSDSNQTLSNLVKIEYKDSKLSQINSKDYVYCGSTTTLPVNYCGMSLDNNGHLVLIKGDSYDFFEGIFKKYTTGYKYKTSQLIDSECDKKFKSLYIDDNGLLIGTERNTGKSYVINISIPELDVNSKGQFITLDLTDYSLEGKKEDLTFKIDNNHSVSYFTKNNKLYLKSIQEGDNVKDYSCLLYEIKIPLRTGYSLSSIKKTMGVLQVEIKNRSKRRILFIDPRHISSKELVVNKISHKPPQVFSSRIGNDPHEKYHAGQPFTSDRKANFSSKNIPLFSSIIDTFRTNIKQAKQHSVEGRHKEAITHIAKAIDPGISAVYTTVPNLVKPTASSIGNNIDSKEKLYGHNINRLRANAKPLSKVANDALGVKTEQNLSKSLINLANEIKPRDTLHLASSDRIAAFFGIAPGGPPFAPGWFAGIVAELSDSHSLTIAKTETSNIRVSFNNRHKVAATGLVGTGQGWEKTLLNTPKIDYMKVMPFEANAIIAAQCILGNNFSFDMSEEHFKEFATQFSEPKKDSLLRNMIITEAKAEKIKEKEFFIRLEAKGELRLQVGSMVNPSTYMVMPRTAVGARLALDLLKIKSNTSESADKKDNIFHPDKENFKVTALDHEAALFAEWKIMPIAMHGGGDDILWCYPLPLLEESKTLAQYTNKNSLTIFEKAVNNKQSTTLVNNFPTINSINIVRDTPILITINDKKGVKAGLKLKKAAKVDKYMGVVDDTLRELRKSLVNKQRNSQNKSSEINVISHYEPITSPFLPSEVVMDNQLSKPNTSEAKAYRLKKLEFRRNSSLQHKDATVPMPILNLSSIHSITYDQFLGEIEFLYHSKSDLSPVNVRRKLTTLY
ncbi:hypothetical protein [Yersinia hibernica]|uniref:Uncharacterized protein n=1 Tax=Yersinia enterocolitica LC20 TaxID=1443113 RepID=A0A7U5PGY1_YEREN|nr:hypothetical protein [Yersinia hibernica]ATX62808.1 hypothetical protein LC20_07375 [Yersinia hibernica]OVZ80566.1 hypothetical protein CBW54_18435 [Yersinia kristensenii]